MTKHSYRHLSLFAALFLAALSFLSLLSATAWGNPSPNAGNSHPSVNLPSDARSGTSTSSWDVSLQGIVTTTVLCSDDTYVWHYRPNDSFGHETTFWAYPNDGIPLLKFPLGGIPAGAEVVTVALTLAMPPGAYPWGSGDVAAVQVLSSADWDEDTVTWNNAPGVDSNAPEAESTLNPYSNGGTDTWDVTELVRYARSQAITDTLSLRIFPKRGNWNDSHEWRSKESDGSSAPRLSVGSSAPRLRVVYRPAMPTPSKLYLPLIVQSPGQPANASHTHTFQTLPAIDREAVRTTQNLST